MTVLRSAAVSAVAGGTRSERRRNRALALALSTGLAARAIAALAPLLLVPVMYNVLGPTLFGVWATATSLASILVFADLGLGASLLTRLSALYGSDDLPSGRSLVTNTYLGVSLASSVGLALTAVVIFGLDPGAAIASETADEANAILATVLGLFFVSLPISMIMRVQTAMQQAWRSSLWTAGGALAGVAAAWLCARSGASAIWVVAAAAIAPVLVMLANNLTFFASGGGVVRPAWRLLSGRRLRGLLGLGGAFALMSVFSNTALNVDNVVVSALSDAAVVAEYAPAARLFSSVSLVITIVGMPLWAAHGDALARQDFTWVVRATRLAVLGLGSIALLGGLVLTLLRSEVMSVWLRSPQDPSLWLFLGLTAWGTLLAVTSPLMLVQNAAAVVRWQLLAWGSYLVVSVTLKALAISRAGVLWIPWAGVAAMLLTLVPLTFLGYRKALSAARRSDHLVARPAAEIAK